MGHVAINGGSLGRLGPATTSSASLSLEFLGTDYQAS